MRNIPDGTDCKATWATYAREARKRARMTTPQFAAAVGVGRTTVWRWEAGKQVPEAGDVVERVALAGGLDLDEALTAAGLRPASGVPSQPRLPQPPLDADLLHLARRLADPDVPAEEKATIRGTVRYLADRLGGAGDRARREAR